jgi:HK97 family phage major capsid protein
MAEPNLQEINEAVGQLRTLVESKSADTSETKSQISKIEKFLDGQEVINQKSLEKEKAQEAKELELKEALESQGKDFKERIDMLEIELSRGGSSNEKNYRDTEEYKALNFLCSKGDKLIAEEHKALLRTDSNTAGGFLVPTEMDSMITKKITEISDVRAIARVRTIASKSLEIPVRDTIPTSTYEGEAEAGGDSQSTYQNETVTPFRQTVTIPITQDMLQDAAFDMQAEIFTDSQESFAQGEGLNHVSGDGHKKPKGFTADTRVQTGARETAASGTLDADAVILLTGDLKTGYNPIYTLNRRTLATIRTLKGGDGHYLWQPGLNGVVASTINGFSYRLLNDMPDIAGGAYSIAFGDFLRGYTIVDRTGLAIVRDEVTQKKKAIIEFTLHRWNTGQVTLPEAIKLLKIKA